MIAVYYKFSLGRFLIIACLVKKNNYQNGTIFSLAVLVTSKFKPPIFCLFFILKLRNARL